MKGAPGNESGPAQKPGFIRKVINASSFLRGNLGSVSILLPTAMKVECGSQEPRFREAERAHQKSYGVKTCPAIDGIVEEADEILKEAKSDTVRDVPNASALSCGRGFFFSQPHITPRSVAFTRRNASQGWSTPPKTFSSPGCAATHSPPSRHGDSPRSRRTSQRGRVLHHSHGPSPACSPINREACGRFLKLAGFQKELVSGARRHSRGLRHAADL